MIYLFWVFFFFFFCLFTFPGKNPEIKVHNIQSWMSKLVFKVVKSCAREMVKRENLLNSKVVSFLESSNSNFGSNQLTSVVDVPCRIIIGKFQPLKQGFGFIVHTRIFKIANFQVRKQYYWWKIKVLKSSLLLQTLWNANLVIKSKYQTRDEIRT